MNNKKCNTHYAGSSEVQIHRASRTAYLSAPCHMMEGTREPIQASFTRALPSEDRQKVAPASTAQVKRQEGKSQQLLTTSTGPSTLWRVIYLVIYF